MAITPEQQKTAKTWQTMVDSNKALLVRKTGHDVAYWAGQARSAGLKNDAELRHWMRNEIAGSVPGRRKFPATPHASGELGEPAPTNPARDRGERCYASIISSSSASSNSTAATISWVSGLIMNASSSSSTMMKSPWSVVKCQASVFSPSFM